MSRRLQRFYLDTSVLGGCFDPEFEARCILSPRFRNDMLHIAMAIVADVDVLVSWNSKHIVRLDKIRLFNGVGLENGYRSLQIYSPREVIYHGNDEN